MFWQLNRGRDIGWTANPIKCSEMLALMGLYGVVGRDEIRETMTLLGSMDAEYLAWSAKKSAAKKE